MTAPVHATADVAILHWNACIFCTGPKRQVWHHDEPCPALERLHLEDLAHAAIRAGLSD